MNRCCFILLTCILLYQPALHAQQSGSDTLRIKSLLKTAESIIGRVGNEKTDMDSALLLISQAESMARQKEVPVKLLLDCKQLRGNAYLEMQVWDSARDVLLSVAEEYGKAGMKYAQARCYELYGGYLNVGDSGIPVRCDMYLKAAALYRSVQAHKEAIHVTRSMAELHHRLGKSEEAIAELKQLIPECRERKSPYLINVYGSLMKVEQSRGNYYLALGYALEAIKAEEALTDGSHPINFYYAEDIARLYCAIDNYEEGVKWHLKQIETMKQGYPQYIYLNFVEMVTGMIKLGRATEALQLTINTEKEYPAHDQVSSMGIYLSKACCYYALKQYKRAEEYFIKSTLVDPQIENFLPVQHSTMAALYFDTRAYAKARQQAQMLLEISEPLQSAANKNQAYYLMFRADSALGNATSALHYLSLHKALSDSIFTDRKEKQTRELLVQYETSKKEKDLQLKAQSIALLQKNADVQTLQLGKARANRNLALSVAGLLVVITTLLLNQYRLNRRNTGLVRKKNDTLEGLVKDKDRLLEEKVWLLKEVHHRVKNNLQTVLSLLESQSYFVNKEALPAIEDSKNRVYAMSLIHKTLYQSEDVTAIHMDAYLKELVQHLRDSMPDDQRILFLLDIDAIELDVSQAVPVGLIVNEAVTNAVKYAFSDRQGRNEVRIAMRCTAGNAVTLTIADNGQGMAVAGKRSEGLGMRLMKGLTEDINGQFTVTGQQGVRIEVAFIANALLPKAADVMAG